MWLLILVCTKSFATRSGEKIFMKSVYLDGIAVGVLSTFKEAILIQREEHTIGSKLVRSELAIETI